MDVGVDVGTTVTKAVVFDDDGRPLAEASRPTRLVRPAIGRFEHETAEIVASVNEVVGELAASHFPSSSRGGTVGDRPGVLAITAQGDGLWLVDPDGTAVRPAISWLDARSSAILERWTSDGVADRVFRRSGNRMFPGASGPLLAAVLAEEPEVIARAGTAAYCKDVVMQQLTGVRATDVSDASAPFLDPRTQQYDDEALEATGLSELQHLLAPVEPAGPVGELRDDSTGMAAGTRVSAGPYDLPAAAAGAGVDQPGDALLTVGTTLACQVVTRELPVDGEPAGLFLGTWTPGVWLRAMPAMVGTAALDRVLALVGLGTDRLPGLLAESRSARKASPCSRTCPKPANARRSWTPGRAARSTGSRCPRRRPTWSVRPAKGSRTPLATVWTRLGGPAGSRSAAEVPAAASGPRSSRTC